jgi:hypothetical protein
VWDTTGWIIWPGIAVFQFDPAFDVVEVVPTGKLLADCSPADFQYLQELYQRSVLPFVMQLRGWECIHASAVVSAKGILVICGKSGQGKSTLAAGLAKHGYPLWADDAVTFSIQDQRVISQALPFKLKVLEDSQQLLSALYSKKSPGLPDPGTKIDVPSAEFIPFQSTFPLACLVILNPSPNTRSDPELVTLLSPAKAFPEILVHAYSITYTPVYKERFLSRYLSLVNQVPVYRANFAKGTDHFIHLVDAVENLINS